MLGAFFMATDWVTSLILVLDASISVSVSAFDHDHSALGAIRGRFICYSVYECPDSLINLMTRPKPQMESVRQVKERASLTRILVTMGVVSAVSGIILAIFTEP